VPSDTSSSPILESATGAASIVPIVTLARLFSRYWASHGCAVPKRYLRARLDALGVTPAMKAKITDQVWDLDELLR
jgi:hypothetical protein